MTRLALAALALTLTACGASRPDIPPPPVVEILRCPSEPPPLLPDLPPRPETGDIRDLVPDRYRVEGLWAGARIEAQAYREAWETCGVVVNP